SLLLELARWAGRRDALVVVVSEGPGADWLAARTADVPALRLLPYQPYDRLPEVLASADVLLTLLEPTAAGFSVPSKVLTYLCAGRPQLASVGRENLAARVVERSGGGVVVPAADPAALVAAAEELLGDPGRRDELGRRGPARRRLPTSTPSRRASRTSYAPLRRRRSGPPTANAAAPASSVTKR